jgi:hypothetical protein
MCPAEPVHDANIAGHYSWWRLVPAENLEFSNTHVDMSSVFAMQVKSPVDASNFHAPHDDNAAGGVYRGKPYISKGDFKDF